MTNYILYTIIAITVITILAIRNNSVANQRLLSVIKENFGSKSKKNYSHDKMEQFRALDNSHKLIIDNITSNDLMIDDLMKDADRCFTCCGEETLYSQLKTPDITDNERNKRHSHIMAVCNNEQERIKLSFVLARSGLDVKHSIYESVGRLSECQKQSSIIHYILMLLFIASVLYCVLVDAVVGMGAILLVSAVNVISYFKFRAAQNASLNCVKDVFSLLKCADKISGCNSAIFNEESRELGRIYSQLSGLMRFSFILANSKNAFDFLLDYLRMLTHVDIIRFNSVINSLKENEEDVKKLNELVGYIDSIISVSSFIRSLPYVCDAEIKDNSVYNAEVLYHPLIEKPVDNSINTSRSILITGSNASGKSTFLRTIGVNQIFSQVYGFAFARKFVSPKYYILSSMGISDSLFKGDSYYMAEIKSLKRILDKIDGVGSSSSEFKVLALVDEVLKGTNTIERISASAQILKKMTENESLIIAATHDLELNHIVNEYYDSFHFSETVDNGDVIFDYKISKGPTTTRNAILLLGTLGYDSRILTKAKEQADFFEKTGTWTSI